MVAQQGAGLGATPKKKDDSDYTANRVLARVIPPLLVGAAGYSLWVYVVVICVNYLLKQGRTALGVIYLIFYFTFFVLMASAFFRLILSPPGYVPTPKLDQDDKKAMRKLEGYRNDKTVEVYVCEVGGGPRWCSACDAPKPDRAHHCSEVGRCVLKMDHFCPWVGGVIGFTRYKFFVQFVTYVAFYTMWILATVSPLIHEKTSRHHHVPGTWIALMAVGGFFALFMIPFSSCHLWYVLSNFTTIEQINQKSKVYLLSVMYDPRAPLTGRAVLSTEPGENPWNLGRLENWKSVMGERWYEWFLPMRSKRGDGWRWEWNEQMVTRLKEQAARSAGEDMISRPSSTRSGRSAHSGTRNYRVSRDVYIEGQYERRSREAHRRSHESAKNGHARPLATPPMAHTCPPHTARSALSQFNAPSADRATPMSLRGLLRTEPMSESRDSYSADSDTVNTINTFANFNRDQRPQSVISNSTYPRSNAFSGYTEPPAQESATTIDLQTVEEGGYGSVGDGDWHVAPRKVVLNLPSVSSYKSAPGDVPLAGSGESAGNWRTRSAGNGVLPRSKSAFNIA
ncbi:Palmitoyltransferase pfa5 [Saitoella coloradoensis]